MKAFRCEGKERFVTFALADRIAKRRSANGINGRGYRCPFCGGFHIGDMLGGRAKENEFRRRRREIAEADQ